VKMFVAVIFIVWVAAVSCVCAADPPVPEDFAHGLPVQIPGDGAIYEITVPLEFYRGVTRSDFSDVCMFNGRREVVPFALRRPLAPRPADSTAPGLPLFPVFGLRDRALDGLSLRIRRNNEGAIIDMNAGEEASSERRIVACLVDAGTLKRPVEALLVEWQTESEGFVGKILVEGSDDLEHWSVLAGNAVIASLRYGGSTLEQRRIALRPTRAKYLRLSWPGSREEVKFTEVRAQLLPESAEPPREWVTLEPSVAKEASGDYFFDFGGYLPADRIRVKLPQKNTLTAAAFFSRTAENAPWKPRQSGAVYSLRIEGTDFDNPDLVVSPDRERFWLMRIDRSGGGIGQGIPRLELGWVPQRLVFIARGDGPFTLAFGSGRVSDAGFQAAELVGRISGQNRETLSIKPATAGPCITLGGPEVLKPRPVHPWKQWILWTVLVLGVILVTWMALSLYRQMNPRESGDG